MYQIPCGMINTLHTLEGKSEHDSAISLKPSNFLKIINALWQLFNKPSELFFKCFCSLSSGRSLHVCLASSNNKLNYMKLLFL